MKPGDADTIVIDGTGLIVGRGEAAASGRPVDEHEWVEDLQRLVRMLIRRHEKEHPDTPLTISEGEVYDAWRDDRTLTITRAIDPKVGDWVVTVRLH